MSDLVLSLNTLSRNIISKELCSLYKDTDIYVTEFHGNWGSLGVSRNVYNGFEPYENNEFIAVVIGGPVLTFRDNDFLNEENSNLGTEAIFNRWQKNEMKWDADLSGPFVVVIINKKSNEVKCVTDLMSFIPVYTFSEQNNMILSTHVDSLASLTNQKHTLDEVSIVDFILHGIVTYPYTMYQSIYQIAPASEHKLIKASFKHEAEHYWLPMEKYKYNSINEAAKELSSKLENYIHSVISVAPNIAQFISGGEDSRVLSGILKQNSRDAFIFVDEKNRESKIAERVAAIYDANFKLQYRNKMHYLNILSDCSDLVGTGSQYHHAHTYGFHKSCELESYTAVFGGLLSDALLKGSHVEKTRFSKKFPFLPDIKDKSYSHKYINKSELFTEDILLELSQRRKNHLSYVQTFRNYSVEEWFELWPSSMNKNIANIDANRRLFRSYEPFTSNGIVKLSASIPQQWKLNRRLFHKAAKTYLKPSKYLLHSKGLLPYFSWKCNSLIQFVTWFYRQVGKRTGFVKGNQGPWGDWRMMIHSSDWDSFMKENINAINKIPLSSQYYSTANNSNPLISLVDDKVLEVNQYVNLTQVLYEINRNQSE